MGFCNDARCAVAGIGLLVVFIVALSVAATTALVDRRSQDIVLKVAQQSESVICRFDALKPFARFPEQDGSVFQAECQAIDASCVTRRQLPLLLESFNWTRQQTNQAQSETWASEQQVLLAHDKFFGGGSRTYHSFTDEIVYQDLAERFNLETFFEPILNDSNLERYAMPRRCKNADCFTCPDIDRNQYYFGAMTTTRGFFFFEISSFEAFEVAFRGASNMVESAYAAQLADQSTYTRTMISSLVVLAMSIACGFRLCFLFVKHSPEWNPVAWNARADAPNENNARPQLEPASSSESSSESSSVLSSELLSETSSSSSSDGPKQVSEVGVICEHCNKPLSANRSKCTQCRKLNVSRLPTIELDESLEDECVVCLDTLSSGESVTRLQCLHQFHQDCIVTWLEQTSFRNAKCPICKEKCK